MPLSVGMFVLLLFRLTVEHACESRHRFRSVAPLNLSLLSAKKNRTTKRKRVVKERIVKGREKKIKDDTDNSQTLLVSCFYSPVPYPRHGRCAPPHPSFQAVDTGAGSSRRGAVLAAVSQSSRESGVGDEKERMASHVFFLAIATGTTDVSFSRCVP